MRFVILSTQRHWGGGESLLLDFARQLQMSGHLVRWVAVRGSEIACHLKASDQQLLYQIQRRRGSLGDWRHLPPRLRAWAPDVIIANDTHAVLLGSLASRFCRCPQPRRLAFKHTVFPLRSPLKYRLLVDRVICVSQAAKQTLLAGGLAEQQCAVIYGGCPIPPALPSPDRFRDEAHLASGQLLIVSVGNLLECKGHRELIAAVGLLKQRHGQFPHRVWIAGEGAQRGALQSQIAASGLEDCVRLLGYQQPVAELLAAADLVVHPSHAEGLSLVLIQAQLFEKPIVATAVGGAVEVLGAAEPSCSAWIAQPRDPDDLATQLGLAITKVHDELGSLQPQLAQTRQRTTECFDIARNTQQLVDLCGELLDQSASTQGLPKPS